MACTKNMACAALTGKQLKKNLTAKAACKKSASEGKALGQAATVKLKKKHHYRPKSKFIL